MQVTNKVKQILSHYSSENAGVRARLCKLLMHGKLSGTGKLVILPVDQGFEHGPDKSFAKNQEAYDPDYHFKLAVDAGLSAYAAPIGMIKASIDKFTGQIPLILKLNSNNSLSPKSKPHNQAITASIQDALELGCDAIGITIYPGSFDALDMISNASELIREANSCGLISVVWSYPRGGDISKHGETSMDICSYAAHIASLLGAHIIKVKPPTDYIESSSMQEIYKSESIAIASLSDRVKNVMRSCFNSKRLVVFSGGEFKGDDKLLDNIMSIKQGGGSGSILGRNSFQRPYNQAISLLQKVCDIYKS
ncbi:MAG: class I fructose-bisphosphate aldolase [Rickettsiaceae bacterium]